MRASLPRRSRTSGCRASRTHDGARTQAHARGDCASLRPGCTIDCANDTAAGGTRRVRPPRRAGTTPEDMMDTNGTTGLRRSVSGSKASAVVAATLLALLVAVPAHAQEQTITLWHSMGGR